MTVGGLLNLVFKAGDTEVQQIQQTVDLQHRQVRHPALQECCICILQHPQETHQQGSAALGRQRAGLAPGLVKTNTQNSVAVLIRTGRKKNKKTTTTGFLLRKGFGRDREPPTGKQREVLTQRRGAMWKECTCFLNDSVSLEEKAREIRHSN